MNLALEKETLQKTQGSDSATETITVKAELYFKTLSWVSVMTIYGDDPNLSCVLSKCVFFNCSPKFWQSLNEK